MKQAFRLDQDDNFDEQISFSGTGKRRTAAGQPERFQKVSVPFSLQS
jgi:hypothetical protein